MWIRMRGSRGLGSALGEARRAAGQTQAGLADQLGVDRTTLIDMEAGRQPALTRLVRAFSLLGYDLIAVPRNAAVSVDENPRT